MSGLKEFGTEGLEWINQYTLNTGLHSTTLDVSPGTTPSINRGSKY